MATVYSRPLKSGGERWYTKVNGKPVVMRSARNKTEARRLAHELETNAERLSHGLEGGLVFQGTFGELCTWAWGVHFAKLRGSKSDRSRLEYHGGATIRSAEAIAKNPPAADRQSRLGTMPAREVTRQELENYFDEIEARPTARGKPMSSGGVNRIRAVFSKVFDLAKSRGKWSGENPAELTDAREAHQGEVSILTLEEIPRVLAALDDYWRGCFAVGLLAGLRKGEIFGLMKADVDLERRRLLVRRSHGNDRTKGQSNSVAEPVPIHEHLLPYIEEAMRSPGPHLFPAHDGKRRKESTKIELRFRAALVRAGICESYDHKCRRKGCGHAENHQDDERRRCPKCNMKLTAFGIARKITFHATRHTLASQALMAGASIQAVQKILRHKDPRLTIKVYGHLAPDFLEGEINRLSIPGLASPSDRVPARANPGEAVGSEAPSGIASLRAGSSRGAQVVHGARLTVVGPPPGVKSSRKHGVSSVEPTGIEPVTYALRIPPSDTSPPGTAWQPFATIGSSQSADRTAWQHEAPLSTGLGAHVVHGSAGVHQSAAVCIAQGSSDPLPAVAPPPLLTVKQVAARLQVSTACIYKHIDTGSLAHSRVGATLRISEAGLAAFLGRASAKGGV